MIVHNFLNGLAAAVGDQDFLDEVFKIYDPFIAASFIADKAGHRLHIMLFTDGTALVIDKSRELMRTLDPDDENYERIALDLLALAQEEMRKHPEQVI